MRSMRARLLLILLLTTGAVWLSAAAWIYSGAPRRASSRCWTPGCARPRRMVDSLITDHRIEIATAAGAIEGLDVETMTDEPYSRQLSCQIWSLAGTLVGRSEAAPRQRLASATMASRRPTIDGETWRVYTVLNAERGVQVMVGDNLQVRRSLVNDVMTGTLLPMTLVLPIAGLLIWLSVRAGLRPLDRMAGLLARRHADDLRRDRPARRARRIAARARRDERALRPRRRCARAREELHGVCRARTEDAAGRAEDAGADRAGVGRSRDPSPRARTDRQRRRPLVAARPAAARSGGRRRQRRSATTAARGRSWRRSCATRVQSVESLAARRTSRIDEQASQVRDRRLRPCARDDGTAQHPRKRRSAFAGGRERCDRPSLIAVRRSVRRVAMRDPA